MVRINFPHSVIFAVVAAISLATPASAQVPVTDLGSLGSFENGSAAFDINNRGEVVGVARLDSSAFRAFR